MLKGIAFTPYRLQIAKVLAENIEPRFTLSVNNAKLRKDGIVSFNMLAILDCPAFGPCAQYCYASSNAYLFPSSIRVRHANRLMSERPEFEDVAVATLLSLPRRWKYVRLHDSGDFYSQAYLDRWARIIDRVRAVRDLRFYAYTKSLHLDFSGLDAHIIQSLGGRHDGLLDMSKPHAKVFASTEELADYVDSSHSDLPAATGAVKIGLVIHGNRSAVFLKRKAA